MSDRCRALARQVPYPVATVNGPVFALLHKYRRSLELANLRLAATDDCIAKLSADYAEGLFAARPAK